MVLSKGANVHDLHGLLVFSTAVICTPLPPSLPTSLHFTIPPTFAYFSFVFFSPASSVEIVEILIDHGAAVDYACGFGNTPLHYAVIHKRAEVVEKLLLKGVNINHEKYYLSLLSPLSSLTPSPSLSLLLSSLVFLSLIPF